MIQWKEFWFRLDSDDGGSSDWRISYRGGANAINMWYDRDIDPKMLRTSDRAIPSGRVEAGPRYSSGFLFPFWESGGSMKCRMK